MRKRKEINADPFPTIDQCVRRADELGMSYGKYVASEQYIEDCGDLGYFKRVRKASKKITRGSVKNAY